MPLTFAHPAAVLPFRRCGLPFSALVVGSMAPDLEYVLRLAPRSEISHTAAGLLVFCLPVGMLGLWLFHRVWTRPMADLLGMSGNGSMGHAAPACTFWPARRFAVLCAAIVVGSMTHVAWDSFTHQYGWMVQRVPSLSRLVLATKWGAVPLYTMLQHGSTAVGLAVLAGVVLHDRTWARGISGRGGKVLAAVLGSSVACGFVVALLKSGWPSDFRAAQRFVGMSVVAISAVLIAMVTLVSQGWRHRRRRLERRA